MTSLVCSPRFSSTRSIANASLQDDEGPLFYWTIPEGSLATVSACLPTLRPLFHGWSPESLIGSIRSQLSLHSLRGTSKPLDKSNSNNKDLLLGRLPSSNSGSKNNVTFREQIEDLEPGSSRQVY